MPNRMTRRYRRDQGWEICVIGTPSAAKFLDADQLAELTGHVVRFDYKQPDEPDALPPPDALVVAPATFNTINNWAQGISDTLALGLLNEAIGLGLPMGALPLAHPGAGAAPGVRPSIAASAAGACTSSSTRTTIHCRCRTWAHQGNDLFPWAALTHLSPSISWRRAPAICYLTL